MIDTIPELLTVEEAGAMLRIGRSRAYAWAASGEMPGVVRLGRSLRVSRRRLLAWIDSETEGGAGLAKPTPLEADRDSDHPTIPAYHPR